MTSNNVTFINRLSSRSISTCIGESQLSETLYKCLSETPPGTVAVLLGCDPISCNDREAIRRWLIKQPSDLDFQQCFERLSIELNQRAQFI
ncbi:MAG: hypothetical protein ABNH02_01085 [Pseudomonadales bacterium]